jgi:hypothetical protein
MVTDQMICIAFNFDDLAAIGGDLLDVVRATRQALSQKEFEICEDAVMHGSVCSPIRDNQRCTRHRRCQDSSAAISFRLSLAADA